jgi:hypothetical protein
MLMGPIQASNAASGYKLAVHFSVLAALEIVMSGSACMLPEWH